MLFSDVPQKLGQKLKNNEVLILVVMDAVL